MGQKSSFTSRIIHSLFNTVTNKKIAVFGFAFKKNTGDVRETPALKVCHMLMQDAAFVHVYDPKVKREDAIRELEMHDMEVDNERFTMSGSPEEAVQDAHAIVVLTEWDCFKTFDYKAFYQSMQPWRTLASRFMLWVRPLQANQFKDEKALFLHSLCPAAKCNKNLISVWLHCLCGFVISSLACLGGHHFTLSACIKLVSNPSVSKHFLIRCWGGQSLVHAFCHARSPSKPMPS